MFHAGLKLYEDRIGNPGCNLEQIHIEWLCMMFAPEKVKKELAACDHFSVIKDWWIYESTGVFMLQMNDFIREYYLVDRDYEFGLYRLRAMMRTRLKGDKNSKMAEDLVEKIKKKLEMAEQMEQERMSELLKTGSSRET